MKPFLTFAAQAALFLGCVNWCVEVVDFWLGKNAKVNLKNRTEQIKDRIEGGDAILVVQIPLRAVSRFFDKIYGERIFSWCALWRSSLVSTLVLISALAAVGIIKGKPFGIDILPWQTFRLYFDVLEKGTKTPEFEKLMRPYLTAPKTFEDMERSKRATEVPPQVRTIRKAVVVPQVTGSTGGLAAAPSPTPYVPATREAAQKVQSVALSVEDWIKLVESYDTTFLCNLYSAAFFILVPLLNCFLDFVCIAVARKIVREMIVARTFTALFALMTLNVVILTAVYILCLMCICFLSYPFGAIVTVGLLVLGYMVNAAFALTMLVPCVLAALWFGPVWIKVASINAALSTLLLSMTSLGSLALFPVRTKVHRFLVHTLSLACEHEKGVLAFTKALLGGLVVLIAFVAKELGGFS